MPFYTRKFTGSTCQDDVFIEHGSGSLGVYANNKHEAEDKMNKKLKEIGGEWDGPVSVHEFQI